MALRISVNATYFFQRRKEQLKIVFENFIVFCFTVMFYWMRIVKPIRRLKPSFS